MGPDRMQLRVLKGAGLMSLQGYPLSYWKGHGNWGGVPDDWKKANVTPIFKEDKEEDSGNYRLGSLTSVPAKVRANPP